MKVRDRVSGACALLFSLFVMWESYGLGLGTLYAPDAGFLPFVSGLTLGFLSLLMLLSSFWLPMKPGTKRMQGDFNATLLLKPFLVMVSLFFFAICLNVFGFLLSTLIFLVFLLKMVEQQKWLLVLKVTVSASILSYVLFDTLLKTQLPKGFLTF